MHNGYNSVGAGRDDDIYLEADKLRGERGIELIAPLRPAIFDCNRTVVDPAQLTQALLKGGDECAPNRGCGRA